MFQICEKRPDLLNVGVEFLEEIREIINPLDTATKATTKNLFKALELIPPTLLVPDNKQIILESFVSWNAFCNKYKMNSIELFIEFPTILMADHNLCEERFNDLRDYFSSKKEVSDFIQKNPSVLLERWPKLKAKLEFIIYEMKVFPGTLSNSKAIEYDLNYIKVGTYMLKFLKEDIQNRPLLFM